jgi:hypothetical protein
MRPALTLVELIVAMAITTLLAVASLQVVTTLARTEKVAQAIGEADYARNSLQRVVTMDLLGAEHFREMTTGSGGFALRTRVFLKPGTLAPEQLPSVVMYEVKKAGERSCLVRRQQTLGADETVDLVAVDVRSIRLAGGGDSRADGEGWKELPAAATVTVEFGKSEKAEFTVRKQ